MFNWEHVFSCFIDEVCNWFISGRCFIWQILFKWLVRPPSTKLMRITQNFVGCSSSVQRSQPFRIGSSWERYRSFTWHVRMPLDVLVQDKMLKQTGFDHLDLISAGFNAVWSDGLANMCQLQTYSLRLRNHWNQLLVPDFISSFGCVPMVFFPWSNQTWGSTSFF